MTRADALRALADGKMIRAVGREAVFRLAEDGLQYLSQREEDWFPGIYGFGQDSYETVIEVEIKTTLAE